MGGVEGRELRLRRSHHLRRHTRNSQPCNSWSVPDRRCSVWHTSGADGSGSESLLPTSEPEQEPEPCAFGMVSNLLATGGPGCQACLVTQVPNEESTACIECGPVNAGHIFQMIFAIVSSISNTIVTGR